MGPKINVLTRIVAAKKHLQIQLLTWDNHHQLIFLFLASIFVPNTVQGDCLRSLHYTIRWISQGYIFTGIQCALETGEWQTEFNAS